MIDVRRTGTEITTVQNSGQFWKPVLILASGLLEEEECGSGTVVCGYHRDKDSICVRDFDRLLKLEWNNPFGINFQLLEYEVTGDSAGVDWTMTPRRCESLIMIAMEMTEEISLLSFDFSILKSVDANRKARHNFIERAGSSVGWLAATLGSGSRCWGLNYIFYVARHPAIQHKAFFARVRGELDGIGLSGEVDVQRVHVL